MEPLAGFLLGVAGSLHCMGMCGPLMIALPRGESSNTMFVVRRGLYHTSRIAAYAGIGALVAVGTSLFSVASFGRTLSIVAGVMMIVAAVLQLLYHRAILPSSVMHRIAEPIRKSMRLFLGKNSTASFVALGALNALLPCGLVASALFGSAATADALTGALFMAAFGAGTFPVMFLSSVGSGLLTSSFRTRFSRIIPIGALLIGVLVLVRGMALGIPYVSPAHTVKGAECCKQTSEHAH